jgi:hypothetical protein
MENVEFQKDTADRNKLQAELIREILGPKASDEEIISWIKENGKHLSDIIDSPEHQEIADLAQSGNYREAAEKVLEILSAEKIAA